MICSLHLSRVLLSVSHLSGGVPKTMDTKVENTQQIEQTAKLAYETPSLVVYGDLRELTQQSGFRTSYDSPLRRFRTS